MLERTVYLATCSLGARSNDLDTALARMLEAMVGRSPWHCFEQQVREARWRFARLIGAHPDQVAVIPNASVGAYQVASTFDWSRRSKLITTDLEFPSVAHVWLAQRSRGVQVEYVPERTCSVSAEDYLRKLDVHTGLVSVPLATYRNGARLPVADVAAAAHHVGARVFVDAYQAVGVVPLDVDALKCDFLVAGAMKYLLGLPGVAFLYARSPSDTDCAPTLTGWFGRVDPMSFDPRHLDFPDEARRFETGTPDVPALYAANAGMALISSKTCTRTSLCSRITPRVSSLPRGNNSASRSSRLRAEPRSRSSTNMLRIWRSGWLSVTSSSVHAATSRACRSITTTTRTTSTPCARRSRTTAAVVSELRVPGSGFRVPR